MKKKKKPVVSKAQRGAFVKPSLEAELQFFIEAAENVSHRVLIYVQVHVTDEAWEGWCCARSTSGFQVMEDHSWISLSCPQRLICLTTCQNYKK